MWIGLGYIIFSIITFEGINDFGVKEQNLFFCRCHICLHSKYFCITKTLSLSILLAAVNSDFKKAENVLFNT